MSQDPHYISFPRSDGDVKKWPTSITENPNAAGEVNWMHYLDLDDPTNEKWRTTVGDSLMRSFKWTDDGRPYILSDFPSGYRLYDHHKGHINKPRHDLYLFGGSHRFRTIYEFIPHAIWLFSDPPAPPDVCRCKYCSHRTQGLVTEELAAAGIIDKKSKIIASSSQSVRTPTVKAKASTKLAATQESASAPVVTRLRRKPEPAVVLTKARSPKPRAQKNKAIPKPSPPNERPKRKVAQVKPKYENTLPEPSAHIVEVKENLADMAITRDRDIRAVSISQDMQSLRMKRWLRPDEVVWVHLERPLMGPMVDGEQAILDYWPAMITDFKLKTTTLPSSDPAIPWIIKQHYEYTVDFVRLPTPKGGFTFHDEAVLPFQAHRPSHAVFKLLQNVGQADADFSLRVADFISSGTSDRPIFDIALPIFHLAFWTTMIMGQFWSLTEKYTIKLPRTASASDLVAAHQSAFSLIPSLPTPNTTSMFGPPEVKPITQFGGMWLGTERIWAGDVVRLKVARRYLAASKAGQRELSSQPFAMQNYQFATDVLDCPVAMRVQRLFLVDTKTPEGRDTKECRVGGLLYELAPEDRMIASTSALDHQERNAHYPLTVSPKDLHSDSVPPSPTEDDPLYPLPDAPPGYEFRPILERGVECVTTLSFIAGRYYPRILTHPLLANQIVPDDVHRCAHLLGLEGIVPFEDVLPIRHLGGREEIVKESERLANAQIRERASQILPQLLDPNAMQVDS